MKFEKVGLMTPGDMGQAVGMQIKARGFTVCTALDHRSERSRALGREVGLIDLGSITRLIEQCDVVLSVMNPGAAPDFVAEAAAALRATKRNTLIVDCNAVAPDTAHQMAATITQAGGRYIDGGIIGPPPRGTATTNLYVSGPGAAELEQLAGPQMNIIVVSDRVGDASALKMCFAAINKGTQLLWLDILIAARRLGVDELLEKQLRQNPANVVDAVVGVLPMLPPKAYRWVPEMQEIAKTLGSAAITSKVFEGAADICAFVAANPLGKESPENRDKNRSGHDVVKILASGLPAK